jgi:eukaryotic-like serine/threonine-protein kinase
MSLSPGTRLGPYEIVAPIGAGGMGEVYRARDTKLQRDVAIKVLPDLFARDPERLARFEREARSLAAVSHPNIAQIYGVVELPPGRGGHGGIHPDGIHLVMEYVDGEDLSQRIAREGAIPLDEAIPIAMQIAEGVAAAHEQGIIHRDLKPANVKVREDGTVKVLDFGLAKALASPDLRSGPTASSLENSPTITSPFQMSQLGVVLGTAAYMAPEQAKGKALDKRVDIWAFGCVLFEMLTARKPFDGEDVTDVLAAIVRDQPDWSRLPAATPPAVRTLLRRCLEKDRRERLPDIGAARLELKEVQRGGTPDIAAPIPAASRRRTAMLPWVIAGFSVLAALVVTAVLVTHQSTGTIPDPRVVKSAIPLPASLTAAPVMRLRVSHDGRRVAFVAQDQSGRPVIWIRPLDGLTAQPIAGTSDALAPFWSPDDRWIAFYAEGRLKKIDLATGAVITLCDASGAPAGSWSRDDVILFTYRSNAIWRIPASGGTPVQVTEVRPGEQTHISPFFLPDGKHFLFSISASGARQPGVFVASLDSKERVQLLDVPTNVAYANGHLLFLRDTTLMAQPFDPATLTLRGSGIPLAEGLQTNPASGTGAFSVSDTGVLVYQTGSSAGTQLTWFDRGGKVLGTLGEPKAYRNVQLSPDNSTVSVTITTTGTQGDVWLFDVATGQRRRWSFDELTSGALWSPDNRFLICAVSRGGPNAVRDLYRRSATGSGGAELLLRDDTDKVPLDVSVDGQTLLYRTASSLAAGSLWLLPLEGDRKPRPLLSGDTTISGAAISPDRKWLAYASMATGRREVFVTSFPDATGQWQVSTDSGDNPVWRADGHELFFYATDGVRAVDVKPSSGRFDSGPERRILSAPVPAAGLGTRTTYAVTRDGQKFLVNTWNTTMAATPLTLVVNWPETVKK